MGRVEHVRPELMVGVQHEERPGQHGNTISTSTVVTSVFQEKMGIRNIVMPARACR